MPSRPEESQGARTDRIMYTSKGMRLESPWGQALDGLGGHGEDLGSSPSEDLGRGGT